MAGPDKKVGRHGEPGAKNLHLSDDICKVCGGNLPKIEDVHLLKDRHRTCIDAVIRGLLVSK